MELDILRALLLKKISIDETLFDPDVLIFKVLGKMFALAAWKELPLRISLKCDQDFTFALRARYATAGYYMNKRYRNSISIVLGGSVPEMEIIIAMMDDSYRLVVKT